MSAETDALHQICTTAANAALTAANNVGDGFYLVLFVNGTWFLTSTQPDTTNYGAYFGYLSVVSTTGGFANATALATALYNAASDPQPGNLMWRYGITPIQGPAPA